MRFLLGIIFIVAGALHFLKADFYIKIMPSYLPYPRALVWVSGFAAIFLGFFLMLPKIQRGAAWGIIIFLLGVFPANIHMWQHPEIFPAIPEWVHWLRLPFQGVLIYWAYCYTKF
jgi:uncharacterized membrane protein